MVTEPKNIRVVLWDVYGTLIAGERGNLAALTRRQEAVAAAYDETARRFSFTGTGEQFLNAIRAQQDKLRMAGIAHPEIRVEEIWQTLVPGASLERAREIAMFFERQLHPRRLMPGAYETLVQLKRRGLRQGIISNAQFYTPIDLAKLLRAESDCADCTYETIFDPTLIFLSCDLGVAKPDPTPFLRARDVLTRAGIAPAECLMVGDSEENDIVPAREVGFRATDMAGVWAAL